MLNRWSSKPTTHKATRLRDNQRRHRQRVKDRIAELEAKLSEAESQLSQALTRIDELSEELRQMSRSTELVQHDGAELSRKRAFTGGEAQKEDREAASSMVDSCCQCQKAFADNPDSAHAQAEDALYEGQTTQLDLGLDLNWYSASIITAGPSAQLLESEGSTYNDSEDEAYCRLPPPSPEESTTRCRDAYAIIFRQNYKGLDETSIRRWLEPGFRGPKCQGDGCRVETKLVFALLDFLSASEG